MKEFYLLNFAVAAKAAEHEYTLKPHEADLKELSEIIHQTLFLSNIALVV